MTTPENRPTIAEAMYPTVGAQPTGKKIEPATVGISPQLASQMGKGAYTAYDKAPPELEEVFWNEPAAASIADYANAFNFAGGYTFERPHELEQGKKAMLALGLGVTQARAVAALYKRSMKSGRVPFTSEEARKAMEDAWGDRTDTNLAEVKALVKTAENHYSGIRSWLGAETGLGNDPDMIKLLHRVVQRRKDRGHG
ncbi:hypothetical protein [Burkholderia seminalis]|uniref:hypothetical protein n=1 Tax=Burkholderia seminalis TaxID=488731 RepID=UPI001453EE56|nr:hypothetical protein [Burkholderia seminalis]MCA8429353.1 hypothetical protein [Burkholderia seminalis]VWC10294.1 hypothetical protein BSE24067_05318 [Burkholderia seminalis]